MGHLTNGSCTKNLYNCRFGHIAYLIRVPTNEIKGLSLEWLLDPSSRFFRPPSLFMFLREIIWSILVGIAMRELQYADVARLHLLR